MLRCSTLATLMIAFAASTSCVNTTRINGSNEADRVADQQQIFHLYRVEIDPEAVRGGAPLLFREPPPSESQGGYRRSQGVFGLAESGFCRCQVRVAESVVGLGGRRSEEIYNLLDFFGQMSSSGEFAAAEGGEGSARGVSIRFTERGKDRLTVQPWLDGRPAAYRYHFQRQGFANSKVPFPWR